VSVGVTVLISTFQRSAQVVRCLEALGRLRFPASELEIIVVDDGSEDGTAAAVEQVHLPFEVRCLRRRHCGPASARNAGIRAARGALIVIIDDDTVADPALVEEHCRSHREHDRLVVMGRVRHLSPGEPPGRWPRLADLSTSFFWTTNVSVARRHLVKAGLFDEDFTEYGWEDPELGDRLRALGLKRRWNWRAVVDHEKQALRPSDVPAMLARAEATGRMAVVYVRKHPTLRARLATGLTLPRRALSGLLGRFEGGLKAAVDRAPDAALRGRARLAAEVLSGVHYYRSAEESLASGGNLRRSS
jgi:glycosyltransferase involved in cell wall biosynthesis